MREQHEHQHLHLHHHLDEDTLKALVKLALNHKALAGKLAEILTAVTKGATTMAGELSDLQTKVQANTDVVDSAITLIQGIKQKLDDAIASNDPAALQALSDALGESNQQLADAVAAGTPVEPTP